ncbi:MAG: hypothetical protein IIA89_10115 [Chloroflexi bacterium]|nr:hypothetical protein [Chloroflexota bacterium]
MHGKKLVQRLNAITEALEARGIGSFCECPHPDGINAGLIVARQLGVELAMEPTITCSNNHHPRPVQKSKEGFGPLLLRLIPTLPAQSVEKNEDASKVGFSENGESKRLKPSIFDRLDYQMQ